MKKIDVQVKMFMKFRKYLPSDSRDGRAVVSVQEGSTLRGSDGYCSAFRVMNRERAVINGISYGVADTQVLKDGDVVSFFSPVAGG